MKHLIKQAASAAVVRGSKHSTRYITISEDEYEGLIETIEFLKNRNLQKRLAESEEDYRKGKVKDLDDAMKEIGVI